jgi:hypothetical protein
MNASSIGEVLYSKQNISCLPHMANQAEGCLRQGAGPDLMGAWWGPRQGRHTPVPQLSRLVLDYLPLAGELQLRPVRPRVIVRGAQQLKAGAPLAGGEGYVLERGQSMGQPEIVVIFVTNCEDKFF